jgi:hypothetical protein
MGTTLTGTTIQDTYDGLIKVTDNGPLSATAKLLTDGLGNDSALSLSTTAVGVGITTPTARAHVRGTGSTAATTTLRVENSGGNAALTILDDRAATFGSSLVVGNSITADRAISQNGGSGLINTTSFNSQQNYPRFSSVADSAVFYYSGTFNPTTGAGRWSAFESVFTINQTGGANGITRGLFINPTLTAAADFRAIEVSIGGAYINTTSVNASAILQSDSTTKGFLPPRMTTTQKNAIATPAAGLVVYDTTLAKLCVYTTAWETITSI